MADGKKTSRYEAIRQVLDNPKTSEFGRQQAQIELNKLARGWDSYNRKNNPGKYADKLEKQAAYYREKAKTQGGKGKK